jgi:putative ABC transport system permease protein
MRAVDLIGSAVANTFRSKTRTILTILAIFVGAFTLTLTSGLGTGINAYIDRTVTSIGATDVLAVTKTNAAPTGVAADKPVEYDPDAVESDQPGPPGSTVSALKPSDLKALSRIKGVRDVQPTRSISPDWIRVGDGKKYVIDVGALVAGQSLQLAAGTQPDDGASDPQLVLPVSFVHPLHLGDARSAIGHTVSIAITDGKRKRHVVDATVVGVAEKGLASTTNQSLVPNTALSDELFDAQSIGVPADQVKRYAQASVFFDPADTDDEISALKDRLTDAGYTGSTVADQLGGFKTVIDGIVLVLDAFAVLALLAAGFGIVNTLLMSVQERTREIGLMKAMGMGDGRVFTLFSLEAAFIGFLGSAIGVVIAMLVGGGVSSRLSASLLSGLPGLTLIAFDPLALVAIVAVVMAIAFLAGTLPAARAARADPVESLRYE